MIDFHKLPVAEPLVETLASVAEFEKTALLGQFPYTDSYQLLMRSAERFGSDPALEFLLQGMRNEASQTISFSELAANITRTANLLYKLGVVADTAVSIVLPILPQTHYAIWGGQAAGIANPINPMLETEHIGEIIRASQSKVVICLGASKHTDIWEKVKLAIADVASVETLLVVNIAGFANSDECDFNHHRVSLLDFNKAIAECDGEKLDSNRTFSADQIAAYFHTGGTTGHPKLAQLTHGNMAFIGQLMRVYTAHMERHTILCGLPLFHIYGVIIQGVAAFSVGYRVVLMTPAGFRSPEAMKNFWHHIARFEVRNFSAVPTVLMALADIPVGDEDISCLININSGAAPLSHPFELTFENKFAVEVSNGYGMTETTALISRAPLVQPPDSVGMRLPYSQIRIVELDGISVVKECELGESGVILVKGPQVFHGYKSKIDNAGAWIEDGWFNTGDLAYLDEQGFLYLSGRAKDLIIRSGHNIDPELIEEALNAHPGVAVAIAIGLPDAYAGELPMAFVVKIPGGNVSEIDLLDYCQSTITERAAIPKRIEFIDTMPLTAVGKIFRPTLRQAIVEKVLREELENKGIAGTVSTVLDAKRGLVAKILLGEKDQLEQVKVLVQDYTFPVDLKQGITGQSQ
ncbi:MAG: acyl-CoA synthetase [Gammaproteobacteria bacterium]|nr:acyl-CoA synthetase [Gammaproteobacteria bacterium]MDP7454982.1 acyl-CoA synthetase [Gammaproteobacteria bacterium]HJO11404.1 acyl-CoA synthetase [Gammaproteobacteria bacterium]